MKIFQPKIIYPAAVLAIVVGLAFDVNASDQPISDDLLSTGNRYTALQDEPQEYDGAMESIPYEAFLAEHDEEAIKAAIASVMPVLERLYKVQGASAWIAHGFDKQGNPVITYVWIKGAEA